MYKLHLGLYLVEQIYFFLLKIVQIKLKNEKKLYDIYKIAYNGRHMLIHINR